MKNEAYRLDREVCKFRILDILRERGMTQSDLANALGISRGTMSTIVNQTSTVSIVRLAEIAKVLRVEMSELFARTYWMEDVIDCGCNGVCGDLSEVLHECRKSRKFKKVSGVDCRFEIDNHDELAEKGYDVEWGDSVDVYYPTASEVSDRGDYFPLSRGLDSKVRRIGKLLDKSEDEVWQILWGWDSVTPEQWYTMCKVFKETAFSVMPGIHVKVLMTGRKNDTRVNCLDIDEFDEIYKIPKRREKSIEQSSRNRTE